MKLPLSLIGLTLSSSLIILLTTTVVEAIDNVGNVRKIKLNEVSFGDLSVADDSTALFVSQVLSNQGIIKIIGVPNLTNAQFKAFNNLSFV